MSSCRKWIRLGAISIGCALALGDRDLWAQEAWQPYRPTKLTRPNANLKYRSEELGLDGQEIPPPKRSAAPPNRIPPPSAPPSRPPDRVVPPPVAREAPSQEEDLPEPERRAAPEPPATRRAIEQTAPRSSAEVDSPLSEMYPQTNEYVDEFDLMPTTDEMLFGESANLGPPRLTKFKDGFFQKFNFQSTVVDPAGSSGFGVTEVETGLTVAVPAPSKDFPLLITPMFDVRFLNGPIAPDLPSQLFSTGIDFMWVPKVNDRLRGVIAVAPMVYSDFQSNDADMFRITGKGVVQWDAIPDELQLMAGVLYLNRDDIRLFPVFGAIWNPTPYWNLELIFPRPKLARLINYGTDHSDWLYVLGEFGGNSWAVKRDSGLQDKVTLRDLRVMLGVERRKNGGVNYRFEVGYVFAREIDYLSTTGADFEPADTLLLRVGTTF